MGTLKDLADAAMKLKNIQDQLATVDQKEAMLSLRETLMTARQDLTDAQEEISRLKAQLKAVQATADFAAGLVEVEGFKYDQADSRPSGLPYCPRCEVAESKFFRLKMINAVTSQCPQCEQGFKAAANGRVHGDLPLPRFLRDGD
jgi:hypothetical protein